MNKLSNADRDLVNKTCYARALAVQAAAKKKPELIPFAIAEVARLNAMVFENNQLRKR